MSTNGAYHSVRRSFRPDPLTSQETAATIICRSAILQRVRPSSRPPDCHFVSGFGGRDAPGTLFLLSWAARDLWSQWCRGWAVSGNGLLCLARVDDSPPRARARTPVSLVCAVIPLLQQRSTLQTRQEEQAHLWHASFCDYTAAHRLWRRWQAPARFAANVSRRQPYSTLGLWRKGRISI